MLRRTERFGMHWSCAPVSLRLRFVKDSGGREICAWCREPIAPIPVPRSEGRASFHLLQGSKPGAGGRAFHKHPTFCFTGPFLGPKFNERAVVSDGQRGMLSLGPDKSLKVKVTRKPWPVPVRLTQHANCSQHVLPHDQAHGRQGCSPTRSGTGRDRYWR